MVRLLLLTLLVSVCSGRSVLGPNDSLERAKELVRHANLFIQLLGYATIEVEKGKYVGGLDTMELKGVEQSVREEDLEGGRLIEVALRLEWGAPYLNLTDIEGDFALITSTNNTVFLNATAFMSHNLLDCTSKILSASVDGGNVKVEMIPPHPEEEAEFYHSFYPDFMKNLNEVILNQYLDYINGLPIVQSVLCVFFEG